MSQYNTKVSIIILTYNQEHIIGRCLDSIVSQKTTHSFEVIIGEDCSTDNTRAVCQKYVDAYPNIVSLMPKKANKGLTRNFRDTIGACTGEYIAQCAGDDWWHNPNKIQLQVDFLDHNPNIGMVHSDTNLYDAVKKTTAEGLNRRQNYVIPTMNYATLLLTDITPIYTPTPCYRHSLMDKVDINMFVEKGWMMEDLPMWLEMSRHSNFGYINESLATYTVAPASACRPESIEKHLKFEESVTQVQKYYRDNYFPQIASDEDIQQADIKRKVAVYRRFKMTRKAFDYYRLINFSGSKIRTISQKSYSLYLLLIFGRAIATKLLG